jgi:hypothetical protein
MKALNYCMACFFGVMGVVCALVAFDASRFDMGCLALVCFILAWVAWGDYKREKRNENTL